MFLRNVPRPTHCHLEMPGEGSQLLSFFTLQTSWQMSPALRRCCSGSGVVMVMVMVVVTGQHIFPSTLASLLFNNAY